jgi:hypothetical protein
MTSLAHPHLRRLLGAAAAAAAFTAIAAQADAAQPLTCGATITKNTTLTADVTGCPGTGIKIGADGITLDLAGHTVSAAAERNPKAHGILNEGHDGVTIRGGTVRGFGAYGVRLSHADHNVVRDMNLVGNFTGVGLFESDNGVVRNTTMMSSRFVGANLTGGAGNRVEHNTISASAGPGVFVHSSPAEPGRAHRIEANALDGNGIEIQPGPRGTRVVGNTIKNAVYDGILTFEPATVLQGNTIENAHVRAIATPNGAVDAGGNTAR